MGDLNTDQYPSNAELRRWAMSKKAGASLSYVGGLPRFVILAWNRAHPERPYVASQAHHGMRKGYEKGCKCDRCLDAGRAIAREQYRRSRDARDEALADELLDGDA